MIARARDGRGERVGELLQAAIQAREEIVKALVIDGRRFLERSQTESYWNVDKQKALGRLGLGHRFPEFEGRRGEALRAKRVLWQPSQVLNKRTHYGYDGWMHLQTFG